MDKNKIICGKMEEVLKDFPDNYFDSIVTDPPYGLNFMGKKWDYEVPTVYQWQQAIRVLKPGGHLLSACGTRTQHRMVVNIEDAGFEIRDNITYLFEGNTEVENFINSLDEEQQRALSKLVNELNPAIIPWVYGSGFPKSLDIGKAIDKKAKEDIELMQKRFEFAKYIKVCREAKGLTADEINKIFNAATVCNHWESLHKSFNRLITWEDWQVLKTILDIDDRFANLIEDRPTKFIEAEREIIGKMAQPATPKAGTFNCSFDESKAVITAPATEAAKQWQGYGTALKPATEFWTLVRKPLSENTVAENVLKHGTGGINIDGCRVEGSEVITNHSRGSESAISKGKYGNSEAQETHQTNGQQLGRFPANLILDEFMAAELDKQSGVSISKSGGLGGLDAGMWSGKKQIDRGGHTDTGGASRFFYCAKADNFGRNKGLKGFEEKQTTGGGGMNNTPDDVCGKFGSIKAKAKNHHPTVKPIELMRYLVRLVTPKHGLCLDPFCGSGSTLIGCKQELINFIGIDLSEEYCKISEARVKAWNPERYLAQTLNF